MSDRQATTWSRRKKDNAPRGVRRHPSGVWAIRYTCGAGHLHKEKVGPVKGDAIRAYHECRQRAHATPGWCPEIDRQQARHEAASAAARERARVSFQAYAESDYLPYAKVHKRSWRIRAAWRGW